MKKHLLLTLLIVLLGAPAFAAVCEIDGAGHADGDDDGILETGEIVYANELMSCLLANELGFGQVDLTGIYTAVNYTPQDVADTGLSLREHLGGLDDAIAAFVASSTIDSFAEWVTFTGVTGGGGATKFLREDGTFQAIPGGGDALVANPLSQFAATTCAQFAGVISGETGSCGSVVLSNSPTLTTPTLGAALATSVTAGSCVFDSTGLACAANSTAGQLMKLLEDSDLGTNFLAIDLAAINLSGDVTHTPDTSGLFNAATFLQLASLTGDQVATSIAGRSLTLTSASPDTLDADAELYTRTASANVVSPTTSSDFFFGKVKAPAGITVTEIDCVVDPADTGESVVITVNEYDGNGDTPAGVDGATTITCGNTNTADDGSLSNAAIDLDDFWGVDVGTVTGTVTNLVITVTYTVND